MEKKKWLNEDERWRADIGKKERKETVHEMKRWIEGMIGRERVSLDQSYVMHFTVLHFSFALSLPLALCCAVFCNLCTNNWFMLSMRERPARANTPWLQTLNFIACTCKVKISVMNASNAGYSAQYYVFSFLPSSKLQTDKVLSYVFCLNERNSNFSKCLFYFSW